MARAAIKFDLESVVIPEGYELSEATLSLYAYDAFEGTYNKNKRLYRVDSSWVEDEITWLKMPWITYDTLSTESVVEPDNSTEIWETFDVRAYTQGFFDGTFDNNGYLVTFEFLGGALFRSSEYREVSYRPKLELLVSDNLSPEITVTSPVAEDIFGIGDTARIKWTASDDVGIGSFVVSFSMDYGSSWEIIDSVAGDVNELSWITPTVNYKSRCFAKVKVYDNEGKASEGKTSFWVDDDPVANIVTSSLKALARRSVRVNGKIIKIAVPESHGAVTMELKDLRGRLVETISVNDLNNTISIGNNLPAGVYFLNVMALDGYKSLHRIIQY